MSNKDVYERYKELVSLGDFSCSEQELNDFILSGLILEHDNNYIVRDNPSINVKLLKPKSYAVNINFNSLINECLSNNSFKKFFFMTAVNRDLYKNNGLIVVKNKEEYYRMYDNDLWLIKLI